MRCSLLCGLTGAFSIGLARSAKPVAFPVVNRDVGVRVASSTTNTWKNPPPYVPIFYDDFSSCSPGSIPSENWIFDIGTQYPGAAPNWGNFEAEYYTDNPKNVHITKDQTLLITPLLNSTGNWSSARIETKRTDFQCPHKKKMFVQAKIKLGNDPVEKQQGIWPAFWALGSVFRGNYTNWPYSSEWDIMESINGLPKHLMTIHCDKAPGGACDEYNGIGNNTYLPRGVFNTFGFEVDRTPKNWTQESLSWYLNGEKKFEVLGARIGDYAVWKQLAYAPHFLLLNVAVGGTLPNVFKLNGTTPTAKTKGGEGSAMEVDYVGVWLS